MTFTVLLSLGSLSNHHTPPRRAFTPVLALLATFLCTLPAAAVTATSTNLTISSGSVPSGTPVTLTATVLFSPGGTPYGGVGQVIFCDAAAPHCTDIHRIGAAQVTAGGANLKFIPGTGAHSYKATFVGTSAATGSTSSSVALTVTPKRTTATSIAQNGSPGNYSAFSAVTAAGTTPPTGTVSILDTSNANYVLGSATLVPTPPALNFTNSQTISTTGSQLYAVASADFNADGKLDLAVSNSASNTVTILLGNGDGTFNLGSVITGFNAPMALVTGDFNSDGKLDLAVVNNGANQIAVLLGTGSGIFGSPITQATGSNPQGLVLGDFNSDGVPDLAVANSGSNTISILLGTGTGTFNVAASPNTGTGPTSIALADFNNDGKQDLIVTNFNDGTATLCFGVGDGTFTSIYSTGVFGGSYSIVTADFNGDGNMDFAVADYQTSALAIFLSDGAGNFNSSSVATASNPIALAVADFNGDGIPDLAAVNANPSGSVSVLLGKGDGTFQTYLSAALGTNPKGIAVGDLNGDGITDLAATNYGGNNVTVLLAQPTQAATVLVSNLSPVGTGTHLVVASYPGDTNFAGSTSGSSSLTAQPVADTLTLTASPASSTAGQQVTLTATLNPFTAQNHTTDGQTVNFTTQGSVLLGSGTLSGGVATFTSSTIPTGTNTLQATYPGDTNFSSSSSNTLSYTVASVTSTTLAIIGGANGVTSVASGTAVTLTATVLSRSSPVSPGLVAFCDAAAAHCTDVHRLGTAQLNSAGAATLRLIPAIGTHSYRAIFLGTTAASSSSSSASPLAVTGLYATSTTLSSSGSPGNYTLTAAVASASRTGPSGTVSFIDTSNSNANLGSAALGAGVSSFTLGSQLTLPTGRFPRAVVSGDFNADGKPDFAIVNYAANTLSIFLGNGDGTFTAAASPSATLSNPNSIALGDFNGDGKQDLAVTNYANNTVSILLGNGDGTFTPVQGAATGNLPYAVVSADFNSDGKPDLAIANAHDNSVTLLLGNGDGTFSAASTLSTGNNPQSIVSADFNNDGNQDLAVSNLNDGTITVFFGNGNGAFPSAVTVPALGDSFSLAVADLDADGNADLVAISSSGNTATILRGNGSGAFTALASPATGSFPLSVAIADINGDGIPDIVTANDNTSSTLTLLLGNGDGTFQTPIQYATGITPQAVALADFNADGYADIITANYDTNNASVLLAAPLQTASASASNISPTGASGPHSVQANYPGDSLHAASSSNTVTLTPLAFAATPTFSPAPGSYTSAQSVTLTSSTGGANANIFYTTDGSSPTTSSTPYTAPISVTTSETIKAIASAPHFQTSPVATAVYTINIPPTISNQPASRTINSGQSATLAISASGTAPLTYQWYSGASPNTAAPIAGATAATYITPTLTSTSSFWVQVNNASAIPANSITAVITVNQAPTCTLTVQPSATALTVVATSTCSDPQSQILTETIAWGDNTSSAVNLANPTNTHTYAAAGAYTVTLSATDTSNLTATATEKISPSQSPICTLGVIQAQTPAASQYPVTVTASCTDPQNQPLTLSLNWGDGTVTTPSGPPPYTHTYTFPTPTNPTGNYKAVLTATDSGGLIGSSAPQSFQIVPTATPVPAGGSNSVSTSIPPTPILPPATQVTFVCSTVSTVINSQTVNNALPSTYGISCTSPAVTLTAAAIPVNVTISTTSTLTASNRREILGKPTSTLALCGLASPFLGIAFLLPLFPRNRRRRLTALSSILILTASLALSSCGGYFKAPASTPTPAGLYYITLVETVLDPPAPTGFVQTSLIVPLQVTTH